MIELAASILCADFARLGAEAQAAVEGGASVVHVDIMDVHFVPNLTIGPPVVAALRRVSRVPLDCHLTIERPDEFIPAFAEAGVDWISSSSAGIVGAFAFVGVPMVMDKLRVAVRRCRR